MAGLIDRICRATGGLAFYAEDLGSMSAVLSSMQPQMYLTQYNISGKTVKIWNCLIVVWHFHELSLACQIYLLYSQSYFTIAEYIWLQSCLTIFDCNAELSYFDCVEILFSDNINLVLQKSGPTYLVINCNTPQTSWPEVRSDSGAISMSVIKTTSYISITELRPASNTDVLVDVDLLQSHKDFCTVNTWTKQPLIHLYTVVKGPRDQWYPRPMHGKFSELLQN